EISGCEFGVGEARGCHIRGASDDGDGHLLTREEPLTLQDHPSRAILNRHWHLLVVGVGFSAWDGGEDVGEPRPVHLGDLDTERPPPTIRERINQLGEVRAPPWPAPLWRIEGLTIERDGQGAVLCGGD